MTSLRDELHQLFTRALFANAIEMERARRKFAEEKLLRADGTHEHLCVMIAPMEIGNGQVLVVNHRKAGQWLFPGGHVEENETLLDTLRREAQEELGLQLPADFQADPFAASVTNINNPLRQSCKAHFDVWFHLPVRKEAIKVDFEEFVDVRWVTLDEASSLFVDPSHLRSLPLLAQLFTRGLA